MHQFIMQIATNLSKCVQTMIDIYFFIIDLLIGKL